MIIEDYELASKLAQNHNEVEKEKRMMTLDQFGKDIYRMDIRSAEDYLGKTFPLEEME